MVRFARLAVAALLAFAVSPAVAQEKPTLRIYTYDSFAAEWGPGPALKAGFEATCNCTVEFTGLDSSIGALRRVQLEGATSKADLVLGLDTSIASEARDTGLFAPSELDLSGLALPSAWTDPEFVPFDFGYFAFVYNKTKVATPPASFEELIALPASFKIAIEDPRSDTPGLGLLLWIRAAYGDRAPEIWAGLKPHVLTMARSWSDAYGLFLKGEADMALSYTTSPAYHTIAENTPDYAAAIFLEGHYPQIEVAGILKSSKNAPLARDFLRYLISPEGQATLPTTNWMYPVADIGAKLPAAFAELPKPAKLLELDQTDIAANKDAWIEQALAALQ